MLLLFVICLWCHVKCEISTYRGAVLEHQSFHLYEPIVNLSQGQYVVNKNIDLIEKSIKEASDKKVDILVLAEVSLFGHNHNYSETFYFFEELVEPNSGVIACNNSLFNDRPILQRLSCLAKNYNIYLCVHNGDNQPCNKSFQNCQSDHYQWSTTAVFDKNGEIVAKYVKMHMVPDETQFDQMSVNSTLEYDDLVTFNMTLMDENKSDSINITFGLLICFDLQFSRPLIPLIQQKNVSNFIFSTSWPDHYASEAVIGEMHKMSKTFNINFLGASTWWINNISNNTVQNLQPFSSGSGIFSDGNILNQYFNTDAKNIGDKLLIADIPININGPNQNIQQLHPYKVINKQPEALCTNYTSHPIVSKPGSIINESVECNYLNDGKVVNFVCNLYAKINKNSPSNINDYWILSVTNGYDMHDGNFVYYYSQTCIFYRCYNNGLCDDDIATIYDTNGTTIFDEINLNANYMEDSVMFLSIFDNKGFVYKDINDETKVGIYKDKNDKKIHAYFRNNTNKDVIINLSVNGREYNMEAVYQK